MSAVIVETYTPTTSSPASVSTWAKGLKTSPGRDVRMLDLRIKTKSYDADGLNRILGRVTNKPKHWKINYEIEDDDFVLNFANQLEKIGKQHLHLSYAANTNPISTTLKVDKKTLRY